MNKLIKALLTLSAAALLTSCACSLPLPSGASSSEAQPSSEPQPQSSEISSESSSKSSSKSSSTSKSSESSKSSSSSSSSSSKSESSQSSQTSQQSQSSEASQQSEESESSQESSEEIEYGYSATINGEKVEAVDVKSDVEAVGNKAKFEFDLQVGDVLVIKEDGVALTFYAYEYETNVPKGTEFVATKEGKHTVWYNNNSELWVNEPVHDVEFVFELPEAFGEEVYLHAWDSFGNNNGWPGARLEKKDGKFVVSIPEGFTNFILSNGKDEGDGQIKTVDLPLNYLVNSIKIVENEQGQYEIEVDPALAKVYFLAGTMNQWADTPALDSIYLGAPKAEHAEQNVAVAYDLELKAGDEFKVVEYSLEGIKWHGAKEAEDPTEAGENVVVIVDGTYTLYLSKDGYLYLEKKVESSVKATVNGELIELKDYKSETDTCDAKYVVELKAGEALAFFDGETPLHYYSYDAEKQEEVDVGENLLALVDGEYVVWYTGGKLWASAPVVPAELTATVDGKDIELTNLRALGDTDRAKYEIELKEGEKIAFKEGEDQIAFYEGGKEGAIGLAYEAPYDGTYTFYYNTKGEMWVSAPAAPMELDPEDSRAAYYVVGDMNKWTLFAKGYGLTKMDEQKDGKDQYESEVIEFKEGEGVKVLAANETDWYGGQDNAKPEPGKYKLYFCPEGGIQDADWALNGGYFTLVKQEDAPQEVNYSATINGEAKEAKNVKGEGDGCVAKFEFELKTGDKLKIKDGETQLHFYVWDSVKEEDVDTGDEYVAKKDGKHSVYYDDKGELWVVEPDDVPQEVVYSATVNGEAIEIEDVKSESEAESNQAKFEIELKAGDKLKIKADDTQLHFYSWDSVKEEDVDEGDEYVAAKDGVHTVWYDKKNELWVNEPKEADPLVNPGYYLVGSMSEWKPSGDYLFVKMDEQKNDKDQYKLEVNLDKAITFKFVNVSDDETPVTTWIPDGIGNNQELAAGEYTIYFVPEGGIEEEGWALGMYYVEGSAAIPEEVVYSATVNGEAVEIEDVKGEEDQCVAKFEVELKVGDKLKIKADDTQLHFYVYDQVEGKDIDKGEEFTAAIEGKHIVWYDDKGELWVTEPSGEVSDVDVNYYLVGSMNNWAASDEFKFVKMDEQKEGKDQYKLELKVEEENVTFKFIGVSVEEEPKIAWYPDGQDNDQVLAEGEYIIYFVPAGVSAMDWTLGLYYVAPKAENPEEVVYTATVNGEAVEIEDVKPAENQDDKAIFEIELKENDVLKIKAGEIQLHYYHYDEELKESVDDGDAYTAVKDGKYTIYLNSANELYVAEPQDETPDVNVNFYLVGSMNEWKAADEFKFVKMDEQKEGKDQYKLEVNFAADVTFKFIGVTDEDEPKTGWFPEGSGNDQELKAGEYTIYFVPEGVEAEDWKLGMYYVAPKGGQEEEQSGVTATVNGEAIELQDVKSQAEAESNQGKYEIALKVGDKLMLKDGETQLHFYSWDSVKEEDVDEGDTFTATIEGVHTVWYDKKNELWVNEPSDPQSEVTYCLVGSIAIYDKLGWSFDSGVVMDGYAEGNKAVKYNVTLAVGDTFKVLDSENKWYDPDGSLANQSYAHFDKDTNVVIDTAGAYDIYLNNNGQIWVSVSIFAE